MNFGELKQKIEAGSEPFGKLDPALKALWYDALGNWNQAHEHAQEEGASEGAWVHAYLHRKEGDISNARYWYRQAGKPVFQGELSEEWEQITRTLLEEIQ